MAIPFAGVDTGKLLVTGMRTAAENHRIIANNIANADTPHFTPTEMDFQKTLRREVEGRSHVDLRTTQARHLDYRSYRPVLARHVQGAKNDYNKVDLDAEVAKLGKNRGNYTTYSALLTKRYRMYKNMLDNLR